MDVLQREWQSQHHDNRSVWHTWATHLPASYSESDLIVGYYNIYRMHLRLQLLLFLEKLAKRTQQDNVCPHVARFLLNLLGASGINLLQSRWCPNLSTQQSPKLNYELNDFNTPKVLHLIYGTYYTYIKIKHEMTISPTNSHFSLN